MKLFPSSMLWRTGLLIALVLLLTQAGSLLLFSKLRQEGQPRQVMARVMELLGAVREAAVLPEERRWAMLQRLADREEVKIYRDGEVAVPSAGQGRPLLQRLERLLSRRFGKPPKLAFQPGGGGSLWVAFDLGEGSYWLVVPRQGAALAASHDWLLWLGVVMLVALAAAYLIVAHVARPIKALAEAAGRIGSGAVVAVAETGPEETRALARTFNRMAEDLRRAETDRSLLLAGVSHDLRTPLARLRLGLELLPGTDQRLKAEMERDIVVMDEILGQFLAYVRGQESETVRPGCDLTALARDMAERYGARGQPVAFASGPPLSLPLRPVAMQRLLANLIDNAYRHGAPPVQLSLEQRGSVIVLAVSDSGPGIPEAELGRVLLPFQRIEAATASQGAGLGLAIADRIAHLHGGHLLLRNRPGAGLTAEVQLPRHGPPPLTAKG